MWSVSLLLVGVLDGLAWALLAAPVGMWALSEFQLSDSAGIYRGLDDLKAARYRHKSL